MQRTRTWYTGSTWRAASTPCEYCEYPCEYCEYPVSTASTPVSTLWSTPVQRARRMLENLVDRQYVMFIFDKRSRDLYGRLIQQCI